MVYAVNVNGIPTPRKRLHLESELGSKRKLYCNAHSGLQAEGKSKSNRRRSTKNSNGIRHREQTLQPMHFCEIIDYWIWEAATGGQTTTRKNNCWYSVRCTNGLRERLINALSWCLTSLKCVIKKWWNTFRNGRAGSRYRSTQRSWTIGSRVDRQHFVCIQNKTPQ